MAKPKANKPAPEEEQAETKVEAAAVCGVVNLHFIPALLAGVPLTMNPMTCTLPPGHAGDHQSPYKTMRDGAIVDAVAYWSDAAT